MPPGVPWLGAVVIPAGRCLSGERPAGCVCVGKGCWEVALKLCFEGAVIEGWVEGCAGPLGPGQGF